MQATPPPSLDGLAKYPTMTSWFRPDVLAKLLWRVIVSDLFEQYADGRLIIAALDTVCDQELVDRAQQFMPGKSNPRVWTLEPDSEGAIWIDFLADLGDGFDATYAIASLLSQETLTIAGHVTRRGQILFMGGDEVYPNAAPETYRRQLRDPYDWAFPDPDPKSTKGPRSTRYLVITTGTTGWSSSWRCSAARLTCIWAGGGRISTGAISPCRFPRSGGSGGSTRSFMMTSINRRRTISRRSRAACRATPTSSCAARSRAGSTPENRTAGLLL